MARIDDLPTEIFLHILGFTLADYPHLAFPHRGHLALALVAIRWHSAIFATPGFWSIINCEWSKRKVSQLLELSGGALIDVRGFSCGPKRSENEELLFQQRHRWKAIKGIISRAGCVLDSMSFTETQRLRSIELHRYDILWRQKGVRLCLDNKPSLERLVLKAPVDLSLSFLPSLRFLDLQDVTIASQERVMDFLAEFRLLEAISFRRISLQTDVHTPTTLGSTSLMLPNLTSLSFDGIPMALLSSITINLKAPSIRYVAIRSLPEDWLEVIYGIRESIIKVPMERTSALGWCTFIGGEVGLVGYDASGSDSPFKETFRFSSLSDGTTVPHLSGYFDELFGSITYFQVHSLHTPDIESDWLLRINPHQVRKLELVGTAAYLSLARLSKLIEDGPHKSQWWLPNLQELVIRSYPKCFEKELMAVLEARSWRSEDGVQAPGRRLVTVHVYETSKREVSYLDVNMIEEWLGLGNFHWHHCQSS